MEGSWLKPSFKSGDSAYPRALVPLYSSPNGQQIILGLRSSAWGLLLARLRLTLSA